MDVSFLPELVSQPRTSPPYHGPGVLVCCQGGSPRNAELPQCLRLQGLWGEAEGLERGTDSTILSSPNSAMLHSSLLTVPGKTAPPQPLQKSSYLRKHLNRFCHGSPKRMSRPQGWLLVLQRMGGLCTPSLPALPPCSASQP